MVIPIEDQHIVPGPNSLRVRVPPDTRQLEILFEPTRAKITAAPNIEPLPAEVVFGDLFVVARWNASPEPMSEVKIGFQVAGENLRALVVRSGNDQWASDPTNDKAYLKWLEARKAISSDDRRQSFFFELDKKTSPILVARACERIKNNAGLSLDEKEKQVADLTRTLKSAEKLILYLRDRLHLRWKGKGQTISATTNVEQLASLKLFSEMIIRCAGPLWQPGISAFASAMEDFAAGELRREIEFLDGMITRTHIASEIDSSNVFMFAELAIACCEVGIDTDFWLPNLASLVLMQDFFIARSNINPFCAMFRPEKILRLSKDERTRIALDAARDGVFRNLAKINCWDANKTEIHTPAPQ